jgi:hypothetical protein
MKKLAVLLVLFLFLGGAGGAGWWFFLREQPEADSAEAVEEESLVSMARFIEVDPIVLPVIREGQVTLHVTTTITVELFQPVEKEQVREFSRRLRDTMLSELHGIYAIRYVQERGYDLPIVKQRLGQAAERVLGEGSVKGVIVKDVNKRALSTG